MPITIPENKKILLTIRMTAEMREQISELARHHKTNATKIVVAMLTEQIRIEQESIKKTT